MGVKRKLTYSKGNASDCTECFTTSAHKSVVFAEYNTGSLPVSVFLLGHQRPWHPKDQRMGYGLRFAVEKYDISKVKIPNDLLMIFKKKNTESYTNLCFEIIKDAEIIRKATKFTSHLLDKTYDEYISHVGYDGVSYSHTELSSSYGLIFEDIKYFHSLIDEKEVYFTAFEQYYRSEKSKLNILIMGFIAYKRYKGNPSIKIPKGMEWVVVFNDDGKVFI
jgi:hypothetical protein